MVPLLLLELLENQEFETRFLQKFSVYLNTIFHPDSVIGLINRFQLGISPEMSRHINRWSNDSFGMPIRNYSEWLSNINVMKTFALYRPQYIRQHIIDYFRLAGTYLLTLGITNSEMGYLNVNGYKWSNYGPSSKFFKGVPLELEAIPKVGYRFARWQGTSNEDQNPLQVIPAEDSLRKRRGT